ncbi:MAG: DUF6516 family protein [Azoarcus sp.]|jgi:hypothetical protein|nr:DUF6516 family protein [Azoarcus sp.]
MNNMKATLITDSRIGYADGSFSKVTVWQVPQPVVGSLHSYKYSLAYENDIKRWKNENHRV